MSNPYEVVVEAFYDKYLELKKVSKCEDDILDDMALWLVEQIDVAYSDGYKEGQHEEAKHWLDIRDRG